MVVGVSCSVVGPKRYERWGVFSALLVAKQLGVRGVVGSPKLKFLVFKLKAI